VKWSHVTTRIRRGLSRRGGCRRGQGRGRVRRDVVPSLVLALPVACVLLFVVWPAVSVAYESLFWLSPLGARGGFAGLSNYVALVQDSLFLPAVALTTLYTVAAVSVSIGVALGLTLLLKRARTLHPLVLLALFSPTVVPAVAAANVWLYFLTPQFGIVDRILALIGLGQINWLGEPDTAVLALILLFVWKFAPYYTFFLFAAVQRIPADLREAAALDGASAWVAFRHITLPLLRPMLALVTIIALIAAVETIDPVYVLTQGGPHNSTNLLAYYLYQLGFSYFEWGQAAALSVLLLALLAGLSALSLLLVERRAFQWQ